VARVRLAHVLVVTSLDLRVELRKQDPETIAINWTSSCRLNKKTKTCFNQTRYGEYWIRIELDMMESGKDM
jgi:hypothetical protein